VNESPKLRLTENIREYSNTVSKLEKVPIKNPLKIATLVGGVRGFGASFQSNLSRSEYTT